MNLIKVPSDPLPKSCDGYYTELNHMREWTLLVFHLPNTGTDLV